ncbi:transmembrane protein 182 isoform X2 [Bos javanicus]|uniref:transmembrane protein 182 isoform X2 n=1 Tax=Bos javanicus TaxID=9906 RepID=UPI002AA864E0|nr:transmembrane protein 182 isoform X2 [Bos javanicus]
MRLNIAIFFGALFGALGVLLFLVAFGSDYWLLATEVAKCSGEQNIENVTFHHEGFFWRCWFNGIVEENDSNIWQFWYTNQPLWKNCTHAYLSPYPFLRGEHNSTSYDSAVIYRGFWAVLMLLGVVAVVTASFLIICAAPFTSHLLYKAGGGAYIAAGTSSVKAVISSRGIRLCVLQFWFHRRPVCPGGDAVRHLGAGGGRLGKLQTQENERLLGFQPLCAVRLVVLPGPGGNFFLPASWITVSDCWTAHSDTSLVRLLAPVSP